MRLSFLRFHRPWKKDAVLGICLFSDDPQMHVGSLCPVVGRKLRALPNLPVQSWVDQRQAIRISGGNLRSRGRSFQQRRAQEAEDADIWKRQRTSKF